MKISICHLYPDVLNLYGDQGNVTCLAKRLAWRNIDVEVTPLPIGEKADMTDFDIFFIGGGQDFEQGLLLEDLAAGKGREIVSAIEDEKVFLAVCGGYQLMGKSYTTHEGIQYDFLGAVDMYTIGCRERMIGDYMFTCSPESSGSDVVSFENHSGKTYLGTGVKPLGTVINGFGNNGEDGTEGVRYKNLLGTYGHGPLLPKNPRLADYILSLALERKYPGTVLPELDDTFENNAHEVIAARLGKVK